MLTNNSIIIKFGIIILLTTLIFTRNSLALECKLLRVSGSTGWHPIVMKNARTNEITGIAYDLIQLISQELKIPLSYEDLPWRRSLIYLEQGKIDIILGIYHTKPRADIYVFSPPFYTNEARVFVHKTKVFNFDSFNDLIGKVGDIPSGGSFGEDFDHFAAQYLILSGITAKDARISRLQRGWSDYFISDYTDTLWELRKHGLEGEVIALPKTVSTTQVHFAFSKKSPCSYLTDRINSLVNKFKTDGTLNSITNKYLEYN